MQGLPGAIPGAYPVYVVSQNTGHGALTKAAADGSFHAEIIAPPGSWVIVKYDPLNGRWLNPIAAQSTRPASINAAPGVTLLAPTSPPSGNGTPFVQAGSLLGGNTDFSIAGIMDGDFAPGGVVRLQGTITLYVRDTDSPALDGQFVNLHVWLAPLFDADGHQRTAANQFYSSILTPTGLPVEHWLGATPASDLLSMGPLAISAPGRLTASFSFELPLPADLSDGTYGLWLDTFADTAGTLGGFRHEVNPFMVNHALALPPFTVGNATRPHLVWTLLTDVPTADGSRGAVAMEDAADFQVASRIASQSHRFIVPRVSKSDGGPLTYRLEPYLPMVAHGDRYIPNPPTIAVKFPSGSLTVRVTRPDGTVDVLGPAPFAGGATRAPAGSSGALLDNGGGHLAEVFQLTSGTGAFDYEFPSYGRFTVELSGTVEDVYGNSYTGGGTYTVYVAEPLDIEPAILPTTPLEVGDFLNPGVSVLPGVPAEVEVRVSLFVESDPGRRTDHVVSGRANRFGTFTPGPGAPRVEMAGPGEFVVETTASYESDDGTLWMGATRWGQVVAARDSTLIAHGRRGRDSAPIDDVQLWFNDPLADGAEDHLRFPFASGDILWQTDNDAGRVIITAQDIDGAVEESIRDWAAQNNYGSVDGSSGGLDDRLRIGELPLGFATSSGLNPALYPEDIVVHGYWYGGVQRPGERVREIISDDDIGTAYWRFGEVYGLQPGMGMAGDLPNDFKFQFGGAVFRDATRGLNRYGIYGSLWVMLPDDDGTGSRVMPPFQGANGGPSGGPIMTIGGEEIDAFVVPLAVRPGSILETGDTFSFSAQLAPTLPGRVDVTITGPGGFERTITGRANAIGYFYDPAHDFVLDEPGVYRVTVRSTFDGATSAGPLAAPYPTGTVLGAADGVFEVYVVGRESKSLASPHPAWSAVLGVDQVRLLVRLPDGALSGSLRYTIAMPGFQLESGLIEITDGRGVIVYDPRALSRTFPNLDIVEGRSSEEPSLVDTVWISVLAETPDGAVSARHFTLQGPDLYAPTTGP